MKKDRIFYRALTILCLLGLLAACAPAATQTAAPAPAATESAAPAPAASEPAATQAPAGESVTLTYLADDSEVTQAMVHALADAYTAKHPNVKVEIENRPQGSDGDNVVKTRLATGDMTDIFFYNAGSLLQALQPRRHARRP